MWGDTLLSFEIAGNLGSIKAFALLCAVNSEVHVSLLIRNHLSLGVTIIGPFKMQRDDSYSSFHAHMQFNTLSHYAESLKLRTFFWFRYLKTDSQHCLRMESVGLCTDIHYLSLKGPSLKEVHKGMVATLGENSPSYTLPEMRVSKFKHCRGSMNDDLCPERPVNCQLTLMNIIRE